MKIINLMIENFKKIKAVELSFDDNGIVMLTGRNKQGKSSVIDAIFGALGGKNALPEKPIRNGENRSVIRLELDELLIERIMTKDGDDYNTRLKVTDVSGDNVSRPQTVLNKLISKIGLRPRKFAKADNQEQLDMLLEAIDIDFDKTDFQFYLDGQEIADGDNPIEIIDNTYDKIYKERRYVGRDRKKAKETLKNYEEIEYTEEVDTNKLIKEKEELQKENRQLKDKSKEKENLKEKMEEKETQISEVKKEIKRLKSKLNNLEDDKKSIELKIDDIDNELKEQRQNYQDREKRIKELEKEIENATETNKKAQKYKEKLKYQKEYKQYDKKYNYYSDMLDNVEDFKQDLMQETEFPIEGLNINNNQIYYNDVPLSQESSTQKLEVGFAVLQALNPELKVVLIEDGNTVDEDNLEFLETLAKDKGYLVLMEYVDENAETGVVIEDGEITTNHYDDIEDRNDPFANVS